MIFEESVGIDIRHDQIGIVYLKGSLNGIKLAGHTILEMDRHLPVKEKIRWITEQFDYFSTQYRLNSPSTFIGLPRDLFIIREICFPLAIKENIASTLRYEMEKYIPIPLQDIHYDFVAHSESKVLNEIKVLLVLAKKKEIEPFFDLCRYLKYGVSKLTASSIGTVNCYSHFSNISNGIPVSLIQIGRETMEINVVQNGIINACQSIPQSTGGASSVTEELIKVLRTMGTPQSPGTDRKKVCLLDNAENRILAEQLGSEMDFDVSHWALDVPDLPAEQLVSAYGLALAGQGKVPMNINLLPMNLVQKKSKAGLYLMVALAVLSILSIGAWAASKMAYNRMVVERLNSEMMHLKSAASQVEKMQSELDESEKRVKFLNSIRSDYVPMVDILNELSIIVPNSAWIKTMDITGNLIKLQGEADAASELINLLESSSLFEDAKFLSTIVKRKDGKESFNIGLKLAAKTHE